MSYVDWKNKIETIRLFATDEMLDLFTNKNYNQFFMESYLLNKDDTNISKDE